MIQLLHMKELVNACYPRSFKASYSQDELVEHFHLDAQDRILLSGIRGDVNRNGAAVLLKSLLYLGYFPTDLNHDQADS